MNKIYLTIGAVIVSTGVNAHQLSSNAGHDSNWNWNEPNHTQDQVKKDSKNVPINKSTTIKGIKGLDGVAKAGECYTSAYVETACKVETKKVLIKEAYDETVVVPAVTKIVDKKIMISPAIDIEEYIPALYENVSKKILIEAAHTEWKKGNFTAITKRVNNQTYCLVEVPARYETKVEKVLRIPASSKIRTVKAIEEIYQETVVVTPATTRVIKSHPAVYSEVEGCVNSSAGHYEWRSILCEQNATTSILTAFERALSNTGDLSTSEVDGIINDTTESAIKSYQRKNGLSVDGLVNIETVKSLGVTY